MGVKFKKGDKVQVLCGKDKEKLGTISIIKSGGLKAVVSGICMAKKHVKPNKLFPQGGILDKEMPIDISNLSHIDPSSGKPCKIGYRILEDGKKIRYSKLSGEIITN